MNKLSIKSRLWITGEEGTFLGEGRVSLLLAIDKFGSIKKAAKSMNMSYLKAWKLVNSMNETSSFVLVEKTLGGKNGGGTSLTEHAYKAIQLFKDLSSQHQLFLEKSFNEQLKKL